MSDIGRQTLEQWYLARLRSLASTKVQTEQLTPMSLVQSDKRLIQELVSKATTDQSERSEQLLKQIEQQRQQKQNESQLVLAALIGLFVVLAAAIF
ncbi:MAG: hypothetical protein K2X81_07505 [Candidatus Obscuribacterales bacterium]|nr:hypothetical protein [Candidatus Obscuribacterales bacterium]